MQRRPEQELPRGVPVRRQMIRQKPVGAGGNLAVSINLFLLDILTKSRGFSAISQVNALW
jgi:hypothetical protein